MRPPRPQNPPCFEPLEPRVLLSATPTGAIDRDYWTGVSSSNLSALTGLAAYPDSPTGSDTLPRLEAVHWANPAQTTHFADNYGQRVYGYLVAPTTGGYTFWIAGDDQSQLWLSTDATPANRVLIASVPSWSSQYQWTKFASQQSAVVNLVAGQKYFIEALQKEGGGSDHLAVGWLKPGEVGAAPSEIVPGSALAVWNAPPDAADDTFGFSAGAGFAGSVAANDNDPETDPLTFTLSATASNGTLAFNPDGTFTYTADTGFAGTDTFAYTADDGQGNADTATVTLNVNGVPTPADDAYTLDEDTALNVSAAAGLIPNDTDPETDALSAALLNGPTHGTLGLNADGSFIYTPDGDYFGPDGFTYTVTDTAGGGATATVTLTVQPVNDAPLAADDGFTTDEDLPLLGSVAGNDTDPDADTLTYTLVAGPAHGTLVFNADGSFAYTPEVNYNGSDVFTYRAGDPGGATDTAAVTITLNPVNDPPGAIDDAYLTDEGGLLGGNVADNDVDGDTLTYTLLTPPSRGGLLFHPDGSFLYQPEPEYFGPDTWTYRVDDGFGGVDIATVRLFIAPRFDAGDETNSVAATPPWAPAELPAKPPSPGDAEPTRQRLARAVGFRDAGAPIGHAPSRSLLSIPVAVLLASLEQAGVLDEPAPQDVAALDGMRHADGRDTDPTLADAPTEPTRP